jgi:hypothetical protein
LVSIRSLYTPIRAATNIARDKPRKISPPTTRGEANIPLMIILHASAVYTWRPDIVPARRARIQTSAVLAAGTFLAFQMLGVFAEFETAIRRERQLEGIEAAKAKGVYKGRPASIEAADVAALKAEGLGASEIACRPKIGRASVYRVMAA